MWPEPLRSEPPAGALDFPAIFEREFAYVWSCLRRLGVAERDAEDQAQQIFLEVFRQLDSLDTTRPLRPWLFGFALRNACNYRRLARHAVEEIRAAPELSDPTPGADEQLIMREELDLGERALQRVEISRRAVLMLHEIDGHTMPEIAEALGIPLNTAYSRLRLARRDYEAAVHRLRLQRGPR